MNSEEVISRIENLCNDEYYQKIFDFSAIHYIDDPLFEKISNINPRDHLYENQGPVIWLDELRKGLQHKLYKIWNNTISKKEYIELLQASDDKIPLIILKPQYIQEDISYLFKNFKH